MRVVANMPKKPLRMAPIRASESLCRRAGVLRAGINLSNASLVSNKEDPNNPQGIAPGLAAELARQLGATVTYVPYENPGLLADAATRDEWDIALLGAEPARAKEIAFTPPYAEVEATYLVRDGSPLRTCADVDAAGKRVCAMGGSAYDLWLTANLEHATIVRPDERSRPASRVLFDDDESLDALAGLRPWLIEQRESRGSGVVLEDRYTSIRQAIGAPRARVGDGAAIMFLSAFVAEAKASGLVAELLEKWGQAAHLSVAKDE